METTTTTILTPDQRLRVFVSSTLQELAEERMAIKQAIQSIHLTPVMFEMGARPHAPRNLYRQYLAQSQIFVGIYWDKYGWVAPDETISGLEDEYNLSGNMPKLIYIKKSEGQREERLTRLLEKIQRDDKVSYKSFTTAKELSSLLVNDLAILLTERFNLSVQNNVSETSRPVFTSVPSIPNALIGRERNIQDIVHLLQTPENRLITLTGPGGIGKTRLAIECARMLEHYYPDGVAYVPLAPLRNHRLVSETINYNLGVKVAGGNNLESLKLFLREKKFLLILDNFEQVIEAASILDDLLFVCPGLKIIVTSRERLSLSFEHVYVVPALSATVVESSNGITQDVPPAVSLFIVRAKAVQPSFTLTEQNRETIFRICRRLEGLPLAIELAASQIPLFSPAMLLQRLDHSLDVLKGNYRDIPDRQKTIRNTIAWSYDLLSTSEQQMLLQMSLYVGGCLMDAVEKMDIEGADAVLTLQSLMNKSLLIRQEDDTHVRFSMLESVREYALETLKEKGLHDLYRQRMADYYQKGLGQMKLHQNEVDRTVILACLEKEHANIREALEYLMQQKNLKAVTDIAWSLWLFWWVNAHTNEAYGWLKRAWTMYRQGEVSLDDHTLAILAANVGITSFLQRDMVTFSESLGQKLEFILAQKDDELMATATLITGVVKTIVKEYDKADQLLQISLDKFTQLKLDTGVSLVLSALGRNSVYNGFQTQKAKAYYQRSMEYAKKDNNEISYIITLAGFALCEVMEKNAEAKKYLTESIRLSQRLHFYEALAWSIEIWSLVSLNEGRFLHAVTLMGAVDHLRQSTQLPVWDDLEAIILNARQQIREQLDPVIFDNAWKAGAAMTLDQIIVYTMEEALNVEAQHAA